MRVSVVRQRKVWDVVVSRKAATTLFPVWLCRYDQKTKKEERILLCQVQNNDRFGWTVVVAGPVVTGLRLVEGFKHRWQAIRYAINVRTDLQ